MIIKIIQYIEEKLLWIYTYKKNRDQFLSSLADNFDNPNILKKLYVWPKLQDKNPADEIHSYADTSKRSLDTLKPFFNNENTQKDGRNHLIILGDAGMGKSSFLLMLKLRSMSFLHIQRYRFELLKIGPNTLNEIDKIENKINTILLLDALDEDIESWSNVKSRLSELVQNTLSFRKVIITCRTQFFPVDERNLLLNSGVVSIYDYKIEALFLSLFKERDINEYLNKKFGFDKKKIIKSKSIISKMKDLKARPLILSHIDDLLDGADSYPDMFSIFNGMITAWLERESRKNQHLSSGSLREICILIAIHMSSQKTRTIKKKHLYKLVEFGILSTSLDKIDIGGRSLLNKNSDGDFRFSHFSIQELLIAEAVIIGYMDMKSLVEINITSLMKEFILQGGKTKAFNTAKLAGTNSSSFIQIENLSTPEYEKVFLKKPTLPLIILYSKIDRPIKEFLNIEKAMYYECSITKTMERSKLKEIDFVKCDLRFCSFEHSIISNTRFDTCSLTNIKMEGSLFKNSVFMNTEFGPSNFKDSHFEECSFIDCSFIETDFERAKFMSCTITNPEALRQAKGLDTSAMDEEFSEAINELASQ